LINGGDRTILLMRMSKVELIFHDKKYQVRASGRYTEIVKQIEDKILESIRENINKSWTRTKRARSMEALELEDALNEYERGTLRDLKTAFPDFRTDYWKVFVKDKGPKWNSNFQKGEFRYTVFVWNMQKPYTYRIKMIGGNKPYDVMYGKYGKPGTMLLSEDTIGMTVDKKSRHGIMDSNITRLPWGKQRSDGVVTVEHENPYTGESYIQYSSYKHPAVYDQVYARRKDGSYEKIKTGGTRLGGRGFHTIGNMTAVRLSTDRGVVKPVNAKRLAFFTTKDVRRLDAWHNVTSGRPYSNPSGGWMFVMKRDKYGKGHAKYKHDLEKIINEHAGVWLENAGWFGGIQEKKGDKYTEYIEYNRII